MDSVPSVKSILYIIISHIYRPTKLDINLIKQNEISNYM